MRTLYPAIRFAFPTLISISLLAVPSASPQAADSTFRASTEAGVETALLPTLYPSSHAANLLVLRNGDVLCFWFSGTWEGDSDVGIVVSRLPKGSATWQTPILIDRQEGKSYQNPVPFQDAHGRIWLFHTSQSAGKGQADSQILETWSDDEGRTWTKPEVAFAQPGSYDRQPIITMDDGAWMLPMYYTPSAGITKGADTNYSAIQISKDSGKTWRECRIPKSDGLVQPSVVKLGAHSYIAFLRSRYADWIYRSTSSDGCAWTAPVPTKLPNNNASIQAARLKDGHLVIAFNNSSAPPGVRKPQTAPRMPLSVALSKDNGKTWIAVRDIETGDAGSGGGEHFPKRAGRDEFSYPSILQVPGGKILIAYTYRREAIKAAEFSEDWLEHGHSSGKYTPR
jgi:predicted neuraminidase